MYKLYLEENISSQDLLTKVLKDEQILDQEMVYNEHGKPYLKNKKLFFNISHDRNMTVLVTSDKEIGVDLEYLTYKPSVVNKYFTPREQEIIKNSKNKEYDFTKIWVMKEAYVKMLGTGILYGLERVDTIKLEKNFEIIDKDEYLIAICRNEV